MMYRLLWAGAAFAWGSVTFLGGLYATFPAAVAKDRVVYEFGQLTRREYAIDIGDLSLWRFSGVDLDDVTVYTVKKGRKIKGEDAPAGVRSPLVHLDALGVRAAPLSMLMGKQAVAFAAEIYGGVIDGEYATSETAVELAFDARSIDLSRLPLGTGDLKLVLKGILSGQADLALDSEDVKSSSGYLKLGFDGLGLGPDSSMAGFTLPEVVFSRAAVAFEVKEGKLEVTEGEFESDMLSATLSGEVALNKKLARSRNRLDLTFSLPEDLDKLAQIAPDLKRSRDEEGRYHVNVGGTIFSPSVRFTRASKAGAKGGVTGGGTGNDDDRPSVRDVGAAGNFDPDQSDEDRRAAREDRIKERRKRLQERRERAASENPTGDDASGEKGGDMGEEFDPMDDLPGGKGGRNPNLQDRFPGGDGQFQGPMDGPMDGMMDGMMPEDGMPPGFDPEQ